MFHGGCTTVHSKNKGSHFSSLTSSYFPGFLFLLCFDNSHPDVCKWYLITILTGISLMTSNVGYPFLNLLTICISSLEGMSILDLCPFFSQVVLNLGILYIFWILMLDLEIISFILQAIFYFSWQCLICTKCFNFDFKKLFFLLLPTKSYHLWWWEKNKKMIKETRGAGFWGATSVLHISNLCIFLVNTFCVFVWMENRG